MGFEFIHCHRHYFYCKYLTYPSACLVLLNDQLPLISGLCVVLAEAADTSVMIGSKSVRKVT